MTNFSRRGFLAASAVAALSVHSSKRVLGANSDLRVAIIGANGIGKTHLMNFPKIPGVRVVAICDVDSDVLGKRSEEFSKEFGPIQQYSDLRKVFDAKDVDAVVLAVPNHWHALGTVWACQAGKDVLVEKPCSYDIWEAQQMQKAAEKYNRIVQVGIQRRSLPHLQEWWKELQGGVIGKIQSVRGLFYSRRQSIGRPATPPQAPKNVDHNLWSGPADLEIPRSKYHYDWHWFWNTGNGELGNNGPHILDLARSAIGANELPKSVHSLGGRYGWDDNGQTPNTQIIRYGYEPAPIILEIRNLPAKAGTTTNNQYRGLGVGIVVECEGGSYVGFDQGTVYDKEGKEIKKISGPIGGDGGRQIHRENFVAAVRSRKTSDLTCSVKQGHLSSSLCHLGNISHRMGSQESLPAAVEKLQSDKLFGETATRTLEHLTNNDLPVNDLKVDLGAALTFDPVSETFQNQPEANKYLRRSYREPFVLPENV